MSKPWSKADIKREFTYGRRLVLVHRSKSVGVVTEGPCHLERTVRGIDRDGDIALYAPEMERMTYLHLPTKENGLRFVSTDDGFLYETRNLGTLTYKWLPQEGI